MTHGSKGKSKYAPFPHSLYNALLPPSDNHVDFTQAQFLHL